MATRRRRDRSSGDERGTARPVAASRPPGGAAIAWRIEAAADNTRVDAWLARQVEVGSRARGADWIDRGKVFLNGRELAHADAGARLREGDLVELWVDRPGTAQARRRDVADERGALRIVHEDPALLVADKPAGMIVEPLPDSGAAPPRGARRGRPGARSFPHAEVTLVDLVSDHLRTEPRSQAYVVHRIDRDTTGLVLFAKTEAAWADLKRQFASRSPERVYLVLLEGDVRPSSGTWRDRLIWNSTALRQQQAQSIKAGSKDALAHYQVVERFREATLVEVTLETGKRNQIRVQAALHGHPVVGEKVYRPRSAQGAARPHASPRQALHATRLAFRHPGSGARLAVMSPLPSDMRQLLDGLRKERASPKARPVE